MNKKKFELEIDQKKYNCIIKYSARTNNVSCKILDNLDIVIVANKKMSLNFIKEFVSVLYIDSIKEYLIKKNNSTRFNLEKNKITLFGNVHDIFVMNNNNKNDKYELGYKVVNLYLKDINNKEKLIRKLLKKESERYLINRGKELSNNYGFEVSEWSVRYMTRCNGLCYSSSKRIVLSTTLITFPKEYIDYVIIHELCHLKHSNHYKEFWEDVKKYCPNYQEIIDNVKKLS